MLIIAEIGENHLGNMEVAKALIEKAAMAGVDYVKFQSYRPDNFKADDSEYQWFSKVFLSDDDHFILKEHATRRKVKFLSSPFSVERAQFLCEKLKLKEIKIASGVMLNFALLDYVNMNADTVFLSTGLATIPEIKKSLSHLDKVKKCYLLHCVTQYPCNDDEANLNAITTLTNTFNLPTGYSDHTIGSEASLAAAALGAKVIEKHFTFDKKCKEGTDHEISSEFEEMKNMVKSIRRIENMLGSGKKLPSIGEKKIIDFVRNRFI